MSRGLREALRRGPRRGEILARGRRSSYALPGMRSMPCASRSWSRRPPRTGGESGRTARPPPRSSCGVALPLADVASEPFAGAEIGRLEELHLRRSSSRSTASSPPARCRSCRRLEALIAEEPLRERFHAQRMLALYRDGRQSDALDAYREAREALIEHIRVEPVPSCSACKPRSLTRTRASTRRRRSSS